MSAEQGDADVRMHVAALWAESGENGLRLVLSKLHEERVQQGKCVAAGEGQRCCVDDLLGELQERERTLAEEDQLHGANWSAEYLEWVARRGKRPSL